MRKITLLLLALITVLSLMACTATKFDGNRTGNDSELIMDFKVLNKTDSQLLQLEQGDIIDVEIVCDSGRLDIVIQKDGNKPVYRGGSVPTGSFQVEIPEDGAYKVSVTGKRAKGSASFIKKAPE